MSDILQRIAELKTTAKNRRDLKRYDRAISLLREAIALGTAERAASSVHEWRAALASELADCWGIIGGVERRWALDDGSDSEQRTLHLQRSVEAYDHGFRYESDPEVGANTKTYNRLNRLLVRVLLSGNVPAPGSAAGSGSEGTLDLRRELEATADQIEAQGSDSVWAAADLALLNVLLERLDAAAAYAPFEKKEPPDFACQSALDGVAPLAADLPTVGELESAKQRLIALRDRHHARH